jgi:Ca2+-binding EF-hand superfamily protein
MSVEEAIIGSQDDYSIGMWQIDIYPIEQGVEAGGQGVEPFLSLIEGGVEGQTYKDIVDYFFYAQILSQNEYTTKLRKLTGKVPLEQLPNLVRAMGCYPTEMEINNMKNEVKNEAKLKQSGSNGEIQEAVDLEYFIKLFVNHRPVYGINNENIKEAFRILGDNGMGINRSNVLFLSLAKLLSMLENEAEKISREDLSSNSNNYNRTVNEFNGRRTKEFRK